MYVYAHMHAYTGCVCDPKFSIKMDSLITIGTEYV